MSLLAASIEDRLFYEKIRGEKLTPHLYIFLIGPGSLGKGTALGGVRRLLCDWAKCDKASGGPIHLHSGNLTYKGIVDLLGGQQQDAMTGAIISNPRIWIMMDELKNNIGEGQIARNFISMMTDMYTGSYDFSDTTRTHGRIRVSRACVNWIVGSTQEWMLDVLSITEIYSGTTARIVFAFEDDDLDNRKFRPIYPPDWDAVMSHLVARVKMLPHVAGQFQMSPDAMALEQKWYYNRKRPDDKAMRPAWKRGQDLAIKLSMLHAIADGQDGVNQRFVIQYKHMYRAILSVNETLRNMQRLLAMTGSEVEQTTDSDRIKVKIKSAGTIEHSPLLRSLPKSITGPKLTAHCKEMRDRGEIRIEYSEKGGKVYHWEKS